ncbi:hypothetical protein ACFWG7_24120 [Streptomyces koyangensis]|uniref:hypothetical protein n=1 Tax=Streptomyces TaxID=1883 RepID=UPI00338A5D6A|nr:hypothetical protein OH717_10460 [Streptomyces albidoflavus]
MTPVRDSEAGSGDVADLEGGEVGVGLFDGFGVRLALGVLGERPVDEVPLTNGEPTDV